MTEILLDIILELSKSCIASWLTLIVLAITLYFVIRYTISSEKLQKTAETQTNEIIRQTNELIRQRRLSNLPSLTMDIDFMKLGYSSSNPGVLTKWENNNLILNFKSKIANFGNGIALNVFTQISCNYFKEGMYFKIEPIDMLKKTIEAKTDPVEISVEFICEKIFKSPYELDTYMESIDEKEDLEFVTTFDFQDIEGTEYRQINKSNSDGIIHGSVIPK